MLCCVVVSNSYQLSYPGSSVRRALAQTAECRGFGSHLGQLFFLKERAVLGVVDLFALPFYLVTKLLSHALSIIRTQ